MATDKQNWTKAYNKKNPKATAAQRAAAFAAWQKAKKGRAGSGGGGGANTPMQLPEGWGMTKGPDIVGGWTNKPNLNADEFELAQGLDKKWYGRRLGELSGLEPWMKTAVQKWDSDQANRSSLMTGLQTQAVNAAQTLADAGSARLTDLAKIANQSSQQSQALGGVAGGPQQMSSPDARAGSVAADSAARAALTSAATAATQAAPNATTLASNSIGTLINRDRSESAATRQKLLTAFRESVASANAAKDKAIAQTYTDQARLLAAAIQSGARLTSEQISQMGQNFRTTQTNETSLANNAADNATSTANAGAGTAARAGAARTKKTNAFVAEIPKLVDGTTSVSVGADGKTSTTVSGGGNGWEYVMGQAIAQGIPLGPVLGALASTSTLGKVLRGNRRNATRIALWMRSKGIPNATIRQVISKHLGVDVGANAGVAGPPSPGRP